MDNPERPIPRRDDHQHGYIFTPNESVKQAQANITLERLLISATALKLMQKIAAGTLTSDSAIEQITEYYKSES